MRVFSILVLASFFLLSFSQDMSGSVAFPEIYNDFTINPGVTGIISANYLHLLLSHETGENQFSIYAGGKGYFLGGDYSGEVKHLISGIGFGNKRFGVGYYYRWIFRDDRKAYSWRLGFLARPYKWFSLGFCYSRNWGDKIRFGLALRPATEIITFSTDLDYNDKIDINSMRLILNPIKGLYLYANWNTGNTYGLGIRFDILHLSLMTCGNNDKNSKISFTTFSRPLESILSPRIKNLKVTISGKYDEAPFLTKKSFPKFVYNLSRVILSDKRPDRLLIELDSPELSFAQYEELRELLKEYRQNGGKVILYTDGLANGSMFLASVADSLIMNPMGFVNFTGIGVEVIYMKRLLDKLGVKADFVQIGKYKTAAEQFIADTMSKYMREELMDFLSKIDTLIVSKVSEGRGKSVDLVRRWINDAPQTASGAKQAGMVDTLMYWNDFEKKYGWKKAKKLSYILRYRNPISYSWADKARIAIVTIDGAIIHGKSRPGDILWSKSAGDETICKIIKSASDDKNVKGIILRVNSPGGSAFASEMIWQAIKRAREKKPVWASMGSLAGSGGYYIPSAASKIYADRLTLTGSIGVIGGKFSIRGLLDKIGLNVNSIYLSPNANFWSYSDTFDIYQRERFRQNLEEVYKIFKERVLWGRGRLTPDSLEKLAQGRIYSGAKAKEIGLIDEIGGLQVAIRDMAKKLRIDKKYNIKFYNQYEKPKLIKYLRYIGLDNELVEDLSLISSQITNRKLFEDNIYYLMPYIIKLR